MVKLLSASRQRLRRWLRWLWSQEGTPGQRARGVAAGVFCGCYPFFGLQTIFSIGIASLVRGNHLLAAAGTLISNPLTYVPLYWFNYQLGSWLLGTKTNAAVFNDLNRSNLWQQGWSFTQRLLLGSTVVGAVLALMLGVAAYVIFQRQKTQQP
ncbi:hypothetical protein KR100_15130 [Synechococcus sp. KORDI-100]|uniref:DUF2062 domain-containing protein n=1 Tax=Synechococcus sp. KORDI-100 TaxID=1280380 RepID=UPI0004E0757F|nr:DUF2062 domain-containing protein [Synechococcus sp. KORDI-100]AII44678.1 hypothetical protein KR100_15130 [Synechococcus sp. KORDI-100]